MHPHYGIPNCVCAQCGISFHVPPSVIAKGKGRFCSQACKGRYQTEHTPQHAANRTCEYCGKAFYAKPYVIALGKGRFCSASCRSRSHVGPEASQWKGGRTVSHGYVIVNVGPRTKMREHRLVMQEVLGRTLLPGEVVHHIDENQLNNSPENLAAMSNSEHMKLHQTPPTQRWAKRDERCLECGTTTIKHNGKGLCVTCYGRLWRHG